MRFMRVCWFEVVVLVVFLVVGVGVEIRFLGWVMVMMIYFWVLLYRLLIDSEYF